MNVCVCFRPSSVRRGDRFFPGTLFQDRLRRPAAGEAGIIVLRMEEKTIGNSMTKHPRNTCNTALESLESILLIKEIYGK